MKVICVMPYLALVVGKEYEVLERRLVKNQSRDDSKHNDPKYIDQIAFLLLKIDEPYRDTALAYEYYYGVKMFKTREEIREEKLNCII